MASATSEDSDQPGHPPRLRCSHEEGFGHKLPRKHTAKTRMRRLISVVARRTLFCFCLECFFFSDCRAMTMGEIGCFLSHYFIWKDVLGKGYSKVVVFEDDIRFEAYFRTTLRNIMEEIEIKVPDWDLIYLGRTKPGDDDESFVQGSKILAWPSYSYGTFGYLLSYKGVEKLLAQKPLQKMIPVDEYLAIIFDQHPEDSWKEAYYPRALVALSAEPLLVEPTHYLGEPYLISDTEDSEVISSRAGEGTTDKDKHIADVLGRFSLEAKVTLGEFRDEL